MRFIKWVIRLFNKKPLETPVVFPVVTRFEDILELTTYLKEFFPPELTRRKLFDTEVFTYHQDIDHLFSDIDQLIERLYSDGVVPDHWGIDVGRQRKHIFINDFLNDSSHTLQLGKLVELTIELHKLMFNRDLTRGNEYYGRRCGSVFTDCIAVLQVIANEVEVIRNQQSVSNK